MMWGVFNTEDPYLVHVAPCNRVGNIGEGHVLKLECPCTWHVEVSELGVRIIVHEEAN
jgi:hypothetical protein